MDVTWLKREVSVPVVVKGIIEPERTTHRHRRPARTAGWCPITAAASSTSTAPPSRCCRRSWTRPTTGSPCCWNSGARRACDIAKALALGAKAVLLGRPICWGLGAAGPEGVARVLSIFTDELKRVMIMTGTPAIPDITPALLSLDPNNVWFRGM